MITTALMRSSSLRIALMYGFMFIAAVVALLVFIYFTTVGFMDRQLDEILESEMASLVREYEEKGLPGLTQSIGVQVSQHPDGEMVFLLMGTEHQRLAGNLDEWPAAPIDKEGWVDFLLHEWDFEKETRPARALTTRFSQDYQLLIGRDVGAREHVKLLIGESLIWALAFTVVLALGIGLLVSSRMTARLEKLHKTARRIMEGDLDQRVPLDGSGDDFDLLAENLNRMLERIQALMTAVQQISNNVAHDLRKPLTRLQHRLEEARTASPAEAAAALDRAMLEVDELMSTFNALLRIARIESRSRRSAFEEVNIGVLLADVGEFYEPAASEKGQTLDVVAEPGLIVQADRNLLFQAMANLVDNAIKYTPEGGQIEVEAKTSGSQVCLTVSDSGPGIPPELREKVFQRFFRVDDSRSTPGNGLGLSLVRAVAELHEGELRLSDNAPGLRFELYLHVCSVADEAEPL